MSSRASSLLLVVIYLAYISLGLPDGTLGVAWPRMSVALGVPVGFAGTLVFVSTLFSAASSFSSGRIIGRFGTGPVVLVSCALTGTGIMLTAHAQNIWWLWLAAIPLGFGAGAVDTGLNGYVARHYSGRHMNWLHACWGIGATGGPMIMTLAIAHLGGWRSGFFTISTIQLGLAATFLFTLPWWNAVPPRSVPVAGDDATATPMTPANSEAGWLSAGIFALYVSVEGTAGLWAGSILVLARGVPQEAAGWCVFAYYGSITVGRVLVGVVVDSWGARRLILAGLLLAIAGACLFTRMATAGTAAAALVMLGLGFAPVYPCLMHEVPRRFAPAAVMSIIARQSGAAFLGGSFVPAAVGWLAQQVSLESVALAVVFGVFLLTLMVRRLDRLT